MKADTLHLASPRWDAARHDLGAEHVSGSPSPGCPLGKREPHWRTMFCRGKRALSLVKMPLSTESAGGAHWHIASPTSAFHCSWVARKMPRLQHQPLTGCTAHVWRPRFRLGLGTGYMFTHAHSLPGRGVENTSIPGVTRLIWFGRRSTTRLFISSYLGTLQLHLGYRVPAGKRKNYIKLP